MAATHAVLSSSTNCCLGRVSRPSPWHRRRPASIASPARLPSRQSLACKASDESSEGGSQINVMTLEAAYAIIGVPPEARFEDILKRKNQLISSVRDREKLMQIEEAYDLLFMQNMKKRLSGELEVSTSVRYADVPAAPIKKSAAPTRAGTPSAAPPTMRAPSLPKLPSTQGLGVMIKAPRNNTVATTQASVFTGLAAWSLASALLESPEAQLADTAGLQLALALIYTIYTLKENKSMQTGKAMAVAMGCLLAGGVLGTLVEAWLRVDIVPIGSFGSPGVLVAEFIIAACAAGAVFLV